MSRSGEVSTFERLRLIWTEVLGVEDISAASDFFDLGGTSIRATQIAARVREELQIDIPLTLFFDATTLFDLAAAIEALRTSQDSVADSSASD